MLLMNSIRELLIILSQNFSWDSPRLRREWTEKISMSKVYKMPVLMAFYNHGNILMEVSEEQLLSSWKEFFSTGTNWKREVL